MKEWINISLILCLFGFYREIRPSEPFITEFLSGEWRNITSEQVNREVYPVGTYSYLGLLVVVFLVTDILRYKPIIVLSALVAISIWCLLLWTSSLIALQITQFLYGFYMAAEVAYYTYIYAKVSKDKYQLATGMTRAANLSGRFFASLMGQLLISFKLMDFRELNYITLGAQSVSLVTALALPAVKYSVYFYSPNSEATISTVESEKAKPKFSMQRAVKLLWKHLIDSYTNRNVVEWSLWWSLAMGGYLMVLNYIQVLWLEIETENVFNGGVEAGLTLLGAISAYGAGSIDSRIFQKYNLWILAICSLAEGGFVITAALTESIILSYVMYIAFGVLYMFMITMASAMVAKELADDSFALIFGINTLFALIFQTIMTVVVISESGFALDPRGQFLVYGSYFIFLSALFLVASLIKFVRKRFLN